MEEPAVNLMVALPQGGRVLSGRYSSNENLIKIFVPALKVDFCCFSKCLFLKAWPTKAFLFLMCVRVHVMLRVVFCLRNSSY